MEYDDYEYARFIMPTADELKRERRIEDYAKANDISFIEAEKELGGESWD